MIITILLTFVAAILLVWFSYQVRMHKQETKRIIANIKARQALLDRKFDFSLYTAEFKEVTGISEEEMREEKI